MNRRKIDSKQLVQMGGMGLTVALLAIGAGLIALAMLPGHHIEKAIVLAWVLFP